jgi:hypothetical protein
VHNVKGVQRAFNYAQLLAGFYGGLLAPWLRLRWQRRPFLADLLLPPLFLAPAFLVMFVYRAGRFTVLTEMRFVLVKIGEMPELALSVGLAGFAYSALRLARPTASLTPQPGDSDRTGSPEGPIPSGRVRGSWATRRAHRPAVSDLQG